MDDIDRQIERDEILMEARIAMRKPTKPVTGRCHFCDEPIPGGFYCDKDCQEDGEKEDRLRAAHPVI